MRINRLVFVICWMMLVANLIHRPLLAQISPSLDAKSFVDLENIQHEVGTGKPIVLVFINADCPIANGYQPALQKLRADFSKHDLDFVMIHGDSTTSIETAKKHRKEYSIEWSVAIDPENAIARHVAAKVTPEAFLIDAKGNVLYRGRIDDRNADYGKKRAVPTREDLRMALEEFIAGKTITTPKTIAIGCVIRLPKNQGDK